MKTGIPMYMILCMMSMGIRKIVKEKMESAMFNAMLGNPFLAVYLLSFNE